MIWNFDPEIAMTPTTEAGKAHAEAWIDAVEIEWGLGEGDRESMLGEVAAIEVEAVAVERERIRTAVRMLPPLSVATEDGDEVNLEGWVSLAEVLAIAKAKETP